MSPAHAWTSLRAMVALLLAMEALGHGSMYEPPSRGSMFLFGFDTVPDHNHWESNCGGREEQWDRNGGKCGVCGDPWRQDEPRDHENGGVYGNGIIVRHYGQGETIAATAFISVSHKGSMFFSLCPLSDRRKPATEECFQRYPLRYSTGELSYGLPKNFQRGALNVSLVLPRDVTCQQCVLRWKYRAGNDWGCDHPGKCCVGCGKRQEEFYACADIAIYPRGYGPPSTPSTSTPLTRYPHRPTTDPPATFRPRPTYPPWTPKPTLRPTTVRSPIWSGENGILSIDKCPVMFCRVICRSPYYCPRVCPEGCRKFPN